MARIVLVGVISSTIYNARTTGRTGVNFNALNRPHGYPDSYEETVKITPEQKNLNDLKHKCKKYGVYKTVEGILATTASVNLLIWLSNVLYSKRPENLSDLTIVFLEMLKQNLLLFGSFVMALSILTFISGLTGFIGAVQKDRSYLGVSLTLQIICELLSPALLVPTLYFVGPSHKGLIILIFLIHFPYNIYIIYVFRHYLRKLKLVNTSNTRNESDAEAEFVDENGRSL